ncbi:hypothetical protein LTR37_017376, partial [Vermiconidia calcicola]
MPDWKKIGDRRGVKPVGSSSPSATPAQTHAARDGQSPREAAEPASAQEQEKLAEAVEAVNLEPEEADVDMPNADEETADPQETSQSQEQDASKHGDDQNTVDTAAAQELVLRETPGVDESQGEASEGNKSEDDDAEKDDEEIESFLKRTARLKKEYNQAGRPPCQVDLWDADGTYVGQCNLHHHETLHDDEKALEAFRKRSAIEHLRTAAPEMLAASKGANDEPSKRQAKRERRNKKLAQRLQDKETKDSEATDGSQVKETDKKKRRCPSCHNVHKDGVKQCWSKCQRCGKRHQGECRKCHCGGWHPSDKCPKQKNAPAAAAAATVQPAQKGKKWTPNQALHYAMHGIENETGARRFTALLNAPDGRVNWTAQNLLA